jgi:flagellin
MRINNNIEAMTTRNSMYITNREMTRSLQKISTGLRINSAADDAAGLGVSENLRTQVRGMGQALKNTQDAIALLNIADGALNEQANIMQRMRELVIQAKNDTYTQTERNYMGQEFGQLMNELDRIAATTTYNGMTIFAIPEQAGTNTNGIYTTSLVPAPETAHKAAQANQVLNGAALGDVNDGGSGHHFNMLIGQNYTAADAAAFNATAGMNFYGTTAENMVTVAFAQMDTNALFHTAPNAAQPAFGLDGSGLFGDFSWNPGFPPGGDLGDFAIDMSVTGAPGGGSLSTKLDLILRVIDGGSNISANERAIVFGNPAVQSPTGLERINKMRSTIGAMTNRLESTVNNLMNQQTNTQAAESVIRDADFAQETAQFTKNQILMQSSTAMLSQANSLPQMVQQLLR